jgi:hypothetical protein
MTRGLWFVLLGSPTGVVMLTWHHVHQVIMSCSSPCCSLKPNLEPIGVVTPLSCHSWRMENGDVARSPWMARGPFSEIGEWRMEKTSCEGFIIFHLGLLLSPGMHTTKSAWWMRKRTSNPSVWKEHKFLPHAGGNGNSHSPFSTGHKRVSHLSPWRSYPIGSSFSSFSILHFSRRCDNP